MKKFKLLFLVFFLFAFQFSFSSSQNADVMKIIVGYGMENQLQYEKTYNKQNIAGEIPRSKIVVLDHLQPSKCFLLNYHSKDFQVSPIHINIKYNAVTREHLFAASINKGLTNVPIYLQTEKFRL